MANTTLRRPERGVTYFAPVAVEYIDSAYPLIYGEARGALVDTRTQECAVVYSTRELAEDALADPAQWHPSYRSRVVVMPVVCVAPTRFNWAEVGA